MLRYMYVALMGSRPGWDISSFQCEVGCISSDESVPDCQPIVPSLLHSRDERFGFWKNHRLVCLRSREFLHGIHGVKAKEGDKFYFVAVFANEQFSAAVAFNLLRGNARKNLIAQQFLVRFRIRSFGPTVPDTRDHIKTKRKGWSHAHYLITAVDINYLAGDCRRPIAGQENSSGAQLSGFATALQGRAFLIMF